MSEQGGGDHGLTHVGQDGRVEMVDVGAKPTSVREAVAEAIVEMSPETAALLADGALPKGDAVTVARIAGIQAAKRTSELIPLCHPLPLDKVEVVIDVDPANGRVTLVATAKTSGKTGVEMEALTAATVAALTIYDMVKAVERGARVVGVELVSKTGGVRGDYHR